MAGVRKPSLNLFPADAPQRFLQDYLLHDDLQKARQEVGRSPADGATPVVERGENRLRIDGVNVPLRPA